MVISIPTSGKNKESENDTTLLEEEGESETVKTELERKLEKTLEEMEGVGQVKVMLMTDGGQGIYASSGTEVTGVLIVAEGAGNSVTVQKIQQAVMALFQIDAHKIRIMKMK